MDLPLPLQGSQVQSLVGELRSGKPFGRAKKNMCIYVERASRRELGVPALCIGPVYFFLSLCLTLSLSFRQLEV